MPPEAIEAKVAQLRAQFPADQGVRIAPDPRGSQIVVLAPPELLRHIEQALQTGRPARRAPPGGPSNGLPNGLRAARPSSAPVVSLGVMNVTRAHGGQWLQLRSPWPALHAALADLWGNRLVESPVVNMSADLAIYTVAFEDKRQVRLQLHRGSNQIAILGAEPLAGQCSRLLAAVDRSLSERFGATKVIPVGKAKAAKIHQAVAALQASRTKTALRRDAQNGGFMAMLFQGRAQQEGAAQPPPNANQNQPNPKQNQPNQNQQQPNPNQPVPPVEAIAGGLTGQVRVEVIEGVGIVISGSEADVKRIQELIRQIVLISKQSEPLIQVQPLQHVNSQALGEIVREVYDSVYVARQGQVSITALERPNALLIIGQKAAVDTVIKLALRLDQKSGPGAQFEVFRLRHMSASAAQETLEVLYPADVSEEGPMAPRLRVIADYRSNSLIVRGSPRDLAEVALLIRKLDTDDTPAELQLRVFPLENSLAQDLADVLQSAIGSQAGAQAAGQAGAGAQQPLQRSSILRFMTLDAKGRRFLKSGILTDVQITADVRANAVLIAAPKESMELIEALIRQLDQIPAAEAQIKVFTIINGDAEAMTEMLEALFGQQTGTGQLGFGAGVQQAAGIQGESSLVPLRFAVDSRTNTIIATGSATDLTIVEAILLRLDESDVRDRKTKVYRLNNAPAQNVSDSINQLLLSQREVEGLGVRSAFQQIQEEVIVVPEIVTNSLIISATPRFFEEIEAIIIELDKRRPMVIVQVLIAEVTLNNTDEFGVELGLQDSLLFDRSLLGDLITTTNTVQSSTAGTVITNTNDIIQGASNTPGFNFPGFPLGNSGSDLSRCTSNRTAGQALSNFSLGRINGELGYGGLVLSAGSESVNVLIRALQECRRLDVLSRPQIMTLENQPAFVQIGKRVQLITGSTFDADTGVTTNVLGTPQNVGIILGVTPRVTPDGMIVMEIDIEKSKVGPESEGVPISIGATGEVIRSPAIDTTLAQTTVQAMSGQTIVLGGLISKSKSTTHRRVPLLASIPLLGHLFRYDNEVNQRTELLIIMTPRIVETEADAEFIKQIEASRMSWVLSDVRKMHGDANLRSRWDHWESAEVPVTYPDMNPSGQPVSPPPITTSPTFPPENPLPPPPKSGSSSLQKGSSSLQNSPTSTPAPGILAPRLTPKPSPGDSGGPATIQQQGGLRILQPGAAPGLRPAITPPRLNPPQQAIYSDVQPAGYRQDAWRPLSAPPQPSWPRPMSSWQTGNGTPAAPDRFRQPTPWRPNDSRPIFPQGAQGAYPGRREVPVQDPYGGVTRPGTTVSRAQG